MSKSCCECDDSEAVLTNCTAVGCQQYMCIDPSSECACPCVDCECLFCPLHVIEYEECACVLCDACRDVRTWICTACSAVCTATCAECNNDQFMDDDFRASLEGYEVSGLCTECFINKDA